jgi:uncharacterized protein with GYD domain
MPKYVVLVNFTAQGMKTIKDLPKRGRGGREAIERAGGKLLDWNLTMGPYDAVVIVEGPDDATMAAVGLAMGSQGDIRTTTLKAFTEAEMAKIVGKLR